MCPPIIPPPCCIPIGPLGPIIGPLGPIIPVLPCVPSQDHQKEVHHQILPLPRVPSCAYFPHTWDGSWEAPHSDLFSFSFLMEAQGLLDLALHPGNGNLTSEFISCRSESSNYQ